MPRDYSRGKIYKIIDNTSNLIYVGSTCEPTLAMRLAKHVADYKRWKQCKSGFVASYEIIENGDYTIALLEDFPCENNDQLRAKEQEWKDKIKSNNKNNPYSGLTKRDYQEHYRVENKQQIQQKHTCPCGGKFTTQHKTHHQNTLKHQAYVQTSLLPMY